MSILMYSTLPRFQENIISKVIHKVVFPYFNLPKQSILLSSRPVIPADLQILADKRLPRNQMRLPLGLTHPFRSQSYQPYLIPQKGEDQSPRGSHVEQLLLQGVQLAVGLVDLQKTKEYPLVHEVSDRFTDLPTVLVETARRALNWMRGPGEEPTQEPCRLAGFLQEGEDLVQDIWHDIPILIFPLDSVLQSDFLRLPPEVVGQRWRSGLGLVPWGSRDFFQQLERLTGLKGFFGALHRESQNRYFKGFLVDGHGYLDGRRLHRERKGVVVLRKIEKDGLLGVAKKERRQCTQGVVDVNVVLNN